MLESGLPTMEQASRFLANLSDLPAGDIVCAAWKRAVGKNIAGHSRAAKLVRETLVVEVEDWLWQRNLMGLSKQILRNLEKAVGPGLVTELEFRIIPRRLGPKTAESSTRAFALAHVGQDRDDEAAGIADPGLRRIYRRKRDREIA